jgi:LacI family transcriptional regulator
MMGPMSAPTPPYRVALIGDRMRPNTFQFMRGVLDFIQEIEHWQILGDRVDPLQVPDDLDLAQVDGAIGMFTEQRWVDQVIAAGVAGVNMSVSLGDSRLPRVSIDDRAIGRMGASHLLERGLPHLGFVAMGDPGWYVDRRREGFVTTVEQVSQRRCFVDDRFGQERDWRSPAFCAWLEGLPKPIGIMACNDAVACRLIAVAQSLSLRIPHDVAILGVDNDMFTAQLMSPQLSSVEPNNRLAGYHAAQLLDGLMAGEKHPLTRWIPPIGVVTRESTDIVMSQDPLVSQAIKYIHAHCGEGITVEDVLNELGVSRRSLERHFKQAAGRTPRGEIRRAQIDRARKMLVTTDAPMYEIAKACGFDPQARFFIVFKREMGMTPGQFRQRRLRA